MGRLLQPDAAGEQIGAVRLFQRLDRARDLATAGPVRRRLSTSRGGRVWPVVPGAYVIGDPDAPVAVCTLTSNDLMQPLARLAGVAIAGRVYTPNLGIERIVLNLTANPRIRFLLLAGKDSPIFQPAQALRALFADGVTLEHRIVGAEGQLPVLSNVPLERIERFRCQLELVDLTGSVDVQTIEREVQALVARDPGSFSPGVTGRLPEGLAEPAVVAIRPGGTREPLAYDSKGFFVITLDRAVGEIVLRHHTPDNRPAHEMRGRSAEPMLLGLLREELVSQLSHAGYLGAELAKAEAALRLRLQYEQDQPLRPGAKDSP
jgi:tetrahydromethanopterin S-methyltransferase subunit A